MYILRIIVIYTYMKINYLLKKYIKKNITYFCNMKKDVTFVARWKHCIKQLVFLRSL